MDPPPKYSEFATSSSLQLNDKITTKPLPYNIVMMADQPFHGRVALSAELDETFINKLDKNAKFKKSKNDGVAKTIGPGDNWKVSD